MPREEDLYYKGDSNKDDETDKPYKKKDKGGRKRTEKYGRRKKDKGGRKHTKHRKSRMKRRVKKSDRTALGWW